MFLYLLLCLLTWLIQLSALVLLSSTRAMASFPEPFIHICAYSFIRSADAGQVINVLFAILIGSFSLALLAPELQGNSHL